MANSRWRVGDPVRVWTSNAISPDPFELTVAAIEHERVWIRAPGVPLKIGDRVLLERWPADDSCYQGPFEIASRVSDSFALDLHDEWTRLQDRSFARVATGPIRMQALWEEREPSEMWIVNLSAGGLLVDTHSAPVAGETLECGFELPDCPHQFRVQAHVVRVVERSSPELTTYRVGIEFDEMTDRFAAAIGSWVRKAQARAAAARSNG